MAAPIKESFLAELKERLPDLKGLVGSRSLFEVPGTSFRLYIRYSKLHPGRKTFFGLRRADLQRLEGYRSVLCFIWDGQPSPLLIPFEDFEDVFSGITPATDGQFKVQVYPEPNATDLYIAGAGRFNVDGYFGWNELNTPIARETSRFARALSHAQIQTLLAAIGCAKGKDVWCPRHDRSTLDWDMTSRFALSDSLPAHLEKISPILSEVDVIWTERGANKLVALFEVEHTTSIYSGLLRFNDVFLTEPQLNPRFTIVADDARRSTFVRQVRRPTFERSGLADACTFMRYENVFDWHRRLTSARTV
ncbi:MAG: hypothetical protein ACR2MF_09140 [Chthoniobacterales bacterium]